MDFINYPRSSRKKEAPDCPIAKKREKTLKKRKVAEILRKCETLRTTEDTSFLEQHPEALKEVSERKKRLEKYKDRALEKEDKPETIELKAKKLATVISTAKHLIVYSGAGISTSAKIPDYRGSQGIWTLLQKGQEIGEHDLSLAEPTFTHMSLYELHKRGILKHTVSQNCDGLHLRSGLPRFSLSEVHGNMYIEVCKHCKPPAEYWRIFDTTPLTSRFQHKTNRICRLCGNPLIDTIVHFGERGSLKWPLNWNGATKAVEKADVILCLGSSLKVMKKYPWLWALDRPQKQRPKVYIVNLQWTPKDSIASIKINGKCDEVMKLVMKHLHIDVFNYDRSKDPIFHHASLLKEEEFHTASQPMLQRYKFNEGEKNQTDESNTGTYISEKQMPSNESEDSKSQTENLIRNFMCIENESIHKSAKIENSFTCEFAKKTENITEVLDLTIDDDSEESSIGDRGNNEKKGNSAEHVVDFEELIDNLDAKASSAKDEIKTEAGIKVEANAFIHQNKSLIDMALLNNSLLTASLALTPAGSASKEALTATALIMNYNNQIITTLTNNLLPYESVANGTASVSVRSQQTCDKSNEMKEVFNNDIEIIESSDEGEFATENSRTATSTAEQYYNQLLASYCLAINGSIPKWSKENEASGDTVTWSDVNYAYSGLHTIVNLPPEDAILWKSSDEETLHVKKKLRSSTAAERQAAKADCKFCWENYETMSCQFYKPINREFKVTTYRNGKTIVCECCDISDEDEEQQTEEDKEKPCVVIKAGWFGKGYRKIQKKRKKQS